MPRRVTLAVVLAATIATTTDSALADPTPPAGDLPAAAPASSESSDRGTTGTLSRVVLGRRRQRVADLYRSFLAAIVNHDLVALSQLFDQNVGDVQESAEIRPREQVIAEFEAWLGRSDSAALASAFEAIQPIVQSAAELRRLSQLPNGMRSDDWLVGTPRLPTNVFIPRSILVRWVDERPVICAVSRLRTHYN